MPPKKPQIRRSGPLDTVDPKLAFETFTRLLDEANQLTWKRNLPEFNAWESDVKIALSRFYGSDSEEYARFDGIWFSPGAYYDGQPDSEFRDAFQHGIEQARLFLASRKRDWEGRVSSSGPPRRTVMANPKDVFVVHGHDHGMKETVARFLSKAGLNPIILHEQPDEGAYDSLNRMTQKSYNDGKTPSSSYLYDVTAGQYGIASTNPVGRLVQSSSGCAFTLNGYDVMGRITFQAQQQQESCSGSYSYYRLPYTYL